MSTMIPAEKSWKMIRMAFPAPISSRLPYMPGHAPPSMAANAAAGATHLLLEEFIQSVEQSQRKHAVAPLASVVRKYLTVKQRQADLRAEAFHNRPDLDEVRDMDVSGCIRWMG